MGDLERPWCILRRKQAACVACKSSDAIHLGAKPLFGKFRPRKKGILFAFEAPNLGDTENAGYITYDVIAKTDETGRFTTELFQERLGLQHENFQVTNAVLCLPKVDKHGGYPVRAVHLRNCADNLRAQIELLDPIVIASVGATALNALRRLYNLRVATLGNIVEPASPQDRWLELPDGRWLFPLFHTGRQGQANRPREKQHADWAALAKFAKQKGVVLND